MMQDSSGHCRDFDFYTGINRELILRNRELVTEELS